MSTITAEKSCEQLYREMLNAIYRADAPEDAVKFILDIIAVETEADRISIVCKSDDMKTMAYAWQRTADGVDNTCDILRSVNLSDYNSDKFYGNDEVLYFDEHSLLVEEYNGALNGKTPKSVAVHNIKAYGVCVGYIAIETVFSSHIWSARENDILSIAAELTGLSLKQLFCVSHSSDNESNALENIGVPVYVINKDYDLLYLNKKTSALFSHAKNGGKCYAELRGYSAPCRECAVFKVDVDGYGQACFCHDDIVTYAAVSLFEWNSQPAYIVSVNTHKGTTEETELFEKRSRLTEKYAFLYKNACDYIIDVDLTTMRYSYTHINNNVISGIFESEGDYEQVMYHIISTYCDESERDDVMRIFSIDSLRSLRGRETHPLEGELNIHFSDHVISYRHYRIFIQSDNHAVISFKDITEDIRRQQKEFLEKNNLYTAVLAHYPLMISANLTKNTYSLLRNDKYHIDMNGAWSGLDECISYFVSTIHPEDRESYARKLNLERITYAFSHGENMLYYEARQKGDDGMYRWIYTRIIRVDSPDDNDIHIIYLVRYIDEEKKSERVLREAQKNIENLSVSKSMFLSRLSNDLRVPLKEISALAENRQNPDISLEKISELSDSVLAIINNICEMSKIENSEIILKKEPFIISDTISEVEHVILPHAKIRDIDFSIDTSGLGEDMYIGDALRIKQLLLNILSNSVKYTHRGGNVALKVSELKRAGGYSFIELALSNSGMSASPEFLDWLSRPYKKNSDETKYDISDSGIGLNFSRRLVSLMGGRVSVDCSRDNATNFSIELRLGLVSDAHGEYDFTGYRIIVVEDNEITSEIIAELLRSKNADVICASSADDAIKILRSAPPCYYDAIFMDIVMPVKTGHDAAREIRSLDTLDSKTIPIIALTAEDRPEDIEKSLASGMNDHIAKPIEPENIFSVLDKFLTKK